MKSYKRYFSFLLSLCIIVSLFITPFSASAQSSDIEEHWAKEQIEKCIQLGLVNGYPDGSFKPNKSITRAELIKLVNSIFKYRDKEKVKFIDVKAADWFYEYIVKAKTAGYVSGYKDGTFKPNSEISREEVSKIIYTILRLKKLDDDKLVGYNDVSSIGWSKDYLNTVVSKGFLGGYPDGSIKPSRAITRAEAIVILDRVVGDLVDKAGIFGPEDGKKIIEGNLTVNTGAVTLQNLVVKGDLHLAAGIGEGDIYVKDVIVEGSTIVNGGGENSIVFENTTLDEVVIFKVNGKIRVVAKGDTNINYTRLESGAKLEQKENEGKGFKNVEIIVIKPNEIVIFDGEFDEIQIKAKVEVSLTENSVVNKLQVDEVSGTKIHTAKGTSIKSMELNSDTQVLGKGTIDSVVVNTLGTAIEQNVKKVILGKGVKKVNIGGKYVTKSTKKSKKSSSSNNSGGSGDQEEPTPITDIGDYPVKDLVFTETGNNIESHKLGFHPPKDFSSEPDNFTGWLLMYSKSDIDEVWEYINELTEDEITDYTNTKDTNRIYKITNYTWADGVGNTMRKGQKDVVTGKVFGPGIYHFYVATYTDDGIVGLKEANKIIDIKPAPNDLKVTGSGADITGYTVDYNSYDDDRIVDNFIFYSQSHIYNIKDYILSRTRSEIETLASQNKGKLVKALEGPIVFNEVQTEIDGTEFDEGLYYVYAAAISDKGVLGLSWAKEIIITKEAPEVPTEPIGDGDGTVLPAGGHTSSSDKDSANFYEYIRMVAGGGTPRIAIFSSSRDTFETVYNHYYFDDPTYGSLEDNFKKLGFEPVFVPLAIDSADLYADHPYFAALVKTCNAVFLQGGDQNKHAKSLLHDDGTDTELMKAIRYVYDRGGIVAGTSAGMAVMGEYAYGYGDPDVVLQTNETEHYGIGDIPTSGDLFPKVDNNNLTVPGIGLVPEQVLNDTHFDVRGRLGRLVVALRDTTKEIGIGADEGTGLAIKNGVGEVVGNHGIFIVDTSGADYEPAGSKNTFGVTGLKVHYLTDGDKYNFKTKEVTVSEGKDEISENGDAELYETEDVFGGDYNMTKAMISLAHSNQDLLEIKVKTTETPKFKTEFYKDQNTKSYTSNLLYVDESLGDYKKTTIIGMNLDVVEETGPDVNPPVITEIKPSSNEYKVYIIITDDLSGINDTTINKDTVKLKSHVNTIYSSSPKYEPDYDDIKVSINEDAYALGDIIDVKGVSDNAGNIVEPQSWVFDGSSWSKVEENNAALFDLKLSEGTLDPAFDAETITYTTTVPNSIANIEITPVTVDENASFTINSIPEPGLLPLNVGENTFGIEVTAKDEVTTKIYTINITRQEAPTSNDATLSNLELSKGDITFDPATTSYNTTVASAVDQLELTPTATDASSTITITVNGEKITSAQVYSIPLGIGSNEISILVTAKDGETTETYQINIARNQPSIVSVTESSGGATLYLEYDAIAVEEKSLKSENITIEGNTYWTDEPQPYLKDNSEIWVDGQNDFKDDDSITITINVKDSQDNSFVPSTWKRVDGEWVKQ